MRKSNILLLGIRNLALLGASSLMLLGVQTAYADENSSKMKQDNVHIRTWNAFAQNILKLHQRAIKQTKTSKTVKTGGYASMPDFYIEESHIKKGNGMLMTKIQWEKANPKVMHSIEMYFHDDKDRVIRDYQAAYLPGYHNAPVQTLITLYNYNGDLKAFRVWDASGFRIVERCTGKLAGKDVDFILDDDEIYNLEDDETSLMHSKEYKACFKGLKKKPGKYLVPQ